MNSYKTGHYLYIGQRKNSCSQKRLFKNDVLCLGGGYYFICFFNKEPTFPATPFVIVLSTPALHNCVRTHFQSAC